MDREESIPMHNNPEQRSPPPSPTSKGGPPMFRNSFRDCRKNKCVSIWIGTIAAIIIIAVYLSFSLSGGK